MSSGPQPVLPDFEGACLTNVVAALVDPGAHPWVPAPVVGGPRLVLLVLDGLGWEQLTARRSLAPTLSSGTGGPITTVVPSTTACALASLTTGLPPAVHGLLGYRLALGGEVLNVLRWQVSGADARRTQPAPRFQPHPPFPALGRRVPVVTRAQFAATGFTAAHLGRSELHPYHTTSGLVVEISRLMAAGEQFVYAYYDGVDRASHAHGLGAHYDAELVAADRLVADVLSVLPEDAALVVTADHGQVEVGQRGEVLTGEVLEGVVLLSGEGRFRWLHARPGATEDVAQAAAEALAEVAWIRTREQVIDEGWLGGEPVPAAVDRLGDVVVAPFEATAILDPSDTGELRMVGRHGSLTAEEMLVPLLAWAGS